MAPLPAPIADEPLELLMLWLVAVIAVLVMIVKIRLVIAAVAKLHHCTVENSSSLLEMLNLLLLGEIGYRLEGQLLLVQRPGDADQTFNVGLQAGGPVWAEA